MREEEVERKWITVKNYFYGKWDEREQKVCIWRTEWKEKEQLPSVLPFSSLYVRQNPTWTDRPPLRESNSRLDETGAVFLSEKEFVGEERKMLLSFFSRVSGMDRKIERARNRKSEIEWMRMMQTVEWTTRLENGKRVCGRLNEMCVSLLYRYTPCGIDGICLSILLLSQKLQVTRKERREMGVRHQHSLIFKCLGEGKKEEAFNLRPLLSLEGKESER